MLNRLRLHQSIQNTIAEMIGHEKVMLEHRFFHRRADLYWPKHSLVFEIQCTPISLRAVMQRNADYEKLGIDVIWILHQKCFNKAALCATEQYLRSRSAFFTNIFTNKTGFIYDQDEVIKGHLRLYKSAPYKIDITKPYKHTRLRTYQKRISIDTLWLHGRGAYGFANDRFKQPLKVRARFSQIKSRLNPLYKRFFLKETSITLSLYYFLKGVHRLRHLLDNGKDIFLRKRNNRMLQGR